MGYKDTSILRDINGDPIPQFYNELTKKFEVLRGDPTFTLYGNSVEVKPIIDMIKGIRYFEIDTGNVFIYDGQEWVEI